MTGRDDGARQALSAAEADRAATDEDYDRSPEDWPRAERAFRAAATAKEHGNLHLLPLACATLLVGSNA